MPLQHPTRHGNFFLQLSDRDFVERFSTRLNVVIWAGANHTLTFYEFDLCASSHLKPFKKFIERNEVLRCNKLRRQSCSMVENALRQNIYYTLDSFSIERHTFF